MNVRSLVPKIDLVRAWVQSSDPDVLVLSETWLKKSVSDSSIDIGDYKLFRADRLSKGGGVAIYVKSKFNANVIKYFSKPKLFELLAVRLPLSSDCNITVIGSYKAPSTSKEAVSFISSVLAELNDSELVLMGDLNWDWLTSASDGLKGVCSELNL